LPEHKFDGSVYERFVGEVIPGICIQPEDAGKENADDEAESDLAECDALAYAEAEEISEDEQIGDLRDEECEVLSLAIIIYKIFFKAGGRQSSEVVGNSSRSGP